MRRLVNWIAGILSGVIAYRLWKRRQMSAPTTAPVTAPVTTTAPEPEPEPEPADPDDRAEELRAKLADARASEEPAPVEPDKTEPDTSAESLEERRRRVHEEGRAAIDRMNDS